MKGFIFSEKGRFSAPLETKPVTELPLSSAAARDNRLTEHDALSEMTGRLLLLLTVLAMCVGILMVYSSGAGWGERKFQDSEYFLWRQVAYTLLGITVIGLVAVLDYRNIKPFTKAIWLIGIGCLAMLLILKATGIISGAARWIGYGKFRFQASDLAKYALIIHLASLLADKRAFIKDFYKSYQPMVIVIGITVVLIALAPNFSTAAILGIIALIMLFGGGVSLKHLVFTALIAVPPALLFVLFGGYRRERIESFLGATSYQNEQALIGLGNGGLFGLGVGASKQRELFLPASYNDFIFAVVGEEYGFIGAFLLLVVFAAIVWCGFSIARHAVDDFGRYLGFGITVALGLYAFVNAGVACHLLPNTGLPLPFISYGGSAMLFNSIGIGLLLSIGRIRKKEDKTAKESAEQRLGGRG